MFHVTQVRCHIKKVDLQNSQINRLDEFSKKMRELPTKEEKLLLSKLSEKFKLEKEKYRFKFIRTQVVIGWYIVDFLIPSKHLIIELDGSQHNEVSNRADDFIRDAYLRSIGFDVLRYSNKELVSNIDSVVDYIELWASLESPISNQFKFNHIIKKQNKLREKGRLKRNPRSYDF